MSDRELSPARSGSAGSIGDKKYRKSLSRSRSPSVHRRSKRSRSRSYSPRPRRGAYRSRSRSPGYRKRSSSYRSGGGYKEKDYGSSSSSKGKKQFQDGRDNPTPSRCLGVFGLSIYTTEQQINHIFSKYGPVERVEVVIDAKTGRSRGFCFVYFESRDDAAAAKDACTGMEIDGRQIRVDFSVTQRAHTPTPGIYMGRPTYRRNSYRGGGGRSYGDDDYYDSGYRGGSGRDNYRRSPSPYYSKRRDYRSRSRSYSPRKKG
uniref:Transformer-2 sex-determining protein n=1 Tax=Cacopsylla melanoneura TaxID=428564 RepID=A0A8D8XWW9_9HEMI